MNSMYCNRVTMTISPAEVIMKFDWLTPTYDNQGEAVEGAELQDSKVIFMSKDAARSLHKMLGEYLDDEAKSEEVKSEQ